MFVLLKPEETGVRTENNYADPKMKGELYQEFETGSIGTGVAIGDYDGDGLPDLFIVSKTESCRLFRNLGNFKFEDVSEKAGVADKGADAMIWKSGATFVDVNNDGKLDLYVCRYNAPNLLYINQGNGTFKEMARAYGLDVKDSSVMAAFCDYDRDGWLDVYIATNILSISQHPNGQRGYLLHNNRDGTFSNVTDRAGIVGEQQSHSATWWDYDNDGWPDLYVAFDYGIPDKLYHNNHNGTFTDRMDAVVPHTSFSSMGADVGDVNNDGLIDFLVADMAATTHQKDQHSLADARGRSEELPLNSPQAPKYHRNALLLNTGAGRCLEAAFLAGVAATDWTWSTRFEDLDNDGRLDLHITNGFPRDPGVDVVKRMQGAETPAERIRIMYESAMQAEMNFALRNTGDLRFENVTAAWGLDHVGVSFGAAFGDLAGDGNLDLVYTNYHAGASLYRNDNDSGHRVMIELRGTVSNRFGIGAYVRIESALGVQAQQLTLSRGYMSSSEPVVHFGLGSDTTIKRLTVTWPSGHSQTFENLGVDRRFTITEPSGAAPTLSWPAAPETHPQFGEAAQAVGLDLVSREEPVDETALQRLLPFRLNRRGPALAMGSLDESDAIAVVIGGSTVDAIRIAKVTTAGKFAAAPGPHAATHVGAEVNDGPVLLFDADGDGRNDLLITKGGNSLPAGAPEYQPKLWLNDGHGGFQPAADDALPALPLNVGAIAAADFNRDGKLDVFLGGRVATGQYPFAPSSALLANHGGKFEDVTDSLAPGLQEVGMVTAALWSDVDDDGWVDLLLTLEWGKVKYFHNKQGQGFEDWTEKAGFAAAGSGWWTSITGADFNGDGKIDYAVGNAGLNTPYQASAERPAFLYAGDFKGGGGAPQLIEAYYEGDRLYPWRSRRDLGAALPAILKKYPTADAFSTATVQQIFGAEKLKAAQTFFATELRSGVFLSQPDGTYRFEALPRIAQISPLQGMIAADFDGDGNTDLYAVQNSYAPIIATGRFDGGVSQLLLGDGKGHFTPISPLQSGLVVPGDAKALVTVDLDRDGWPDLIASRNNSSLLVFHNGGVADRRSTRVRLRGAAGNLTAAGAKVTAVYADGHTQTIEVYSGSGYYSQSSGEGFFGWTESNPLRELRVRWPSGATSESKVSAGSTSETLIMP